LKSHSFGDRTKVEPRWRLPWGTHAVLHQKPIKEQRMKKCFKFKNAIGKKKKKKKT